MDRWTIEQLNSTDDMRFAACILQERMNKLNPYSPLATKLARTIRKLDEMNVQESAKVMESVRKMEDMEFDDPEGLLGYSIESEINCYQDTGHSVIETFKRYPAQAAILEDMLIAVCGWGVESLVEKMKEKADYYNRL